MATAKNKQKNRENALEDVVLVAGTQQNLSNLYSLDIYGSDILAPMAPRLLVKNHFGQQTIGRHILKYDLSVEQLNV
jgi:hypothetical protein